MRLGELKKILDNVVDDTNKIVIDSKQLYAGHVYKISNYSVLIAALDAIKTQSWIDFSSEIVETLNSKISKNNSEVEITNILKMIKMVYRIQHGT